MFIAREYNSQACAHVTRKFNQCHQTLGRGWPVKLRLLYIHNIIIHTHYTLLFGVYFFTMCTYVRIYIRMYIHIIHYYLGYIFLPCTYVRTAVHGLGLIVDTPVAEKARIFQVLILVSLHCIITSTRRAS